MVARHEGDRAWRQEANPVEFAAVQQHLAEPEIISTGRDHPAAAGWPFRFAAHVRKRRAPPGRWIDLRLGETLDLRLGHEKPRRIHPERLQNPLRNKLIEGNAGYDLDDPSEHVGRIAIFPGCPRLV